MSIAHLLSVIWCLIRWDAPKSMLFCYVNVLFRWFDVISLNFPGFTAGEAVQVHCIATEPTFFGNYAPPDDLDGQIIDLVSLSKIWWWHQWRPLRHDHILFTTLQIMSNTYILLLPYNDNTLHIGFCRPMAFTCLYYFHIFSHLFSIIIHWIFTCIFAAVCTGGRARGQGPGLGPMKRTALSRLSIDESIEVATRCPSSARLQLKPQGLSFARDLARHAEARRKLPWNDGSLHDVHVHLLQISSVAKWCEMVMCK
jgi:hypothetical protein